MSDQATNITRRIAIVSAALVPLAALQTSGQTSTPGPVFAPTERRLLEAVLNRLIPADQNGPGALECGAADYFERQLSGDLASEKVAILEGLASLEAYAVRTFSGSFPLLAPDQQDAALTAIQDGKVEGFAGSAAFFNRVRRLTLEGTFGDPYYGGNKGYAGWDLIRYPGPRLAVSSEEQKMTNIKPMRASAWGVRDGH